MKEEMTLGQKIDSLEDLRRKIIEAWEISSKLGNCGMSFDINRVTVTLWENASKVRALLGSHLVDRHAAER